MALEVSTTSVLCSLALLCALSGVVENQSMSQPLPLTSHPLSKQHSTSSRLERRTPTETSLHNSEAIDSYQHRAPSPLLGPLGSAAAASGNDALNSVGYVPSSQFSSIGHYTRVMPANNPIASVEQSQNSYLTRNNNNIHLIEQPSYQIRKQQRAGPSQSDYGGSTETSSHGTTSGPYFAAHYGDSLPHSLPARQSSTTESAALGASRNDRSMTNAYLDSSQLLGVPVLDANDTQTTPPHPTGGQSAYYGAEDNQQQAPSIGLHTDTTPAQDSFAREAASLPTTSAPTTTTMTTDQSNNIFVQTLVSERHDDGGQVAHELTTFASHLSQMFANNSGSSTAPNDHLISSNQVIYEAPREVSSSALDSYYFSSSEKLPKVDSRSSNVWW